MPLSASSRVREQSPSSLPLSQILHDITGQVLPGEVLALMGPSGSGKTSLLSVVSGRAPKMMKTEGEVTINNKPLTKITKRRMGFVTQVCTRRSATPPAQLLASSLLREQHACMHALPRMYGP